MFDSKLSGKKKLIKDGQTWKEVIEDVAFSKSFDLGTHSCTIIQHGDKYEFRIDNQVFSHLMDLEKNKVHFGNFTPTTNVSASKIIVAPKNDERPSLFSFKINPVNGENKPKFANKKISTIEVESKQHGSNLLDFNEVSSHNITEPSSLFDNNTSQANSVTTNNNKTVNLLDLGFDNVNNNNVPVQNSQPFGFIDFNSIPTNNMGKSYNNIGNPVNMSNTGSGSFNIPMNNMNVQQNTYSSKSDQLLSALNTLPQQPGMQSNQLDYFVGNPSQLSYPNFDKVNYGTAPTNMKSNQPKDPFSDLFG